MSINSEDVRTWIGEIMKKKGVKKYRLDISDSAKGDGYSCDVCFVKVTVEEGKDAGEIYDVVVKAGKVSEKLRENCPIVEIYFREIVLYTKVLPMIEQLQKEYGIKNCFTHYAPVFYTSKEDRKEAILLQNMKVRGYMVHDRTVPHNLEEALLAFRTYAKWHGASMAFKIKKPELFHEVTNNMNDNFGDILFKSRLIESFPKFHQLGLNVLKKVGQQDMAKKIEEEASDFKKMCGSLTLSHDKEAEREAVILHGDCWNNNMMFKYKDMDISKPIDMVLLDFQMSRLASPILDLSYYLYSTADRNVLDKFDHLLEEYHKELENYLRQYDINVDDLLTLKRLRTSWRKYGRFGFAMSAFILRAALSKEDEVIDFSAEVADSTIQNLQINVIEKEEEYDRRILDVYTHFYKTCLL
ncbi:unnamed protein product [Phyllotreta striolata]|uniref:CHK kinase-like domain-containing protein n=1 Tax=Phyllotreta striolata TaxID=444603 RepID=A0A9N9XJE3_PHYSR|nr:unnamed protein product [Phyllotreta striolata]